MNLTSAAARHDLKLQREDMSELKMTIATLTEVNKLQRTFIEQGNDPVSVGSYKAETSRVITHEDSASRPVIEATEARESSSTRVRWGKLFFGSVEVGRAMRVPRLLNASRDQGDIERELEEIRMTVRLPTWLLPYRYQFRMTRAYTGWEYCIRS